MKINFPKHKGLFITATDTGVGKTLVSGAIANILTQKGKKIGVFKPVATGCKKIKGKFISEDAEFLAACIDNKIPTDIITSVKYKIPASPLACEMAESKKVDFEKILATYKQICRSTDFVIVEGIGGVKVPITRNFDVLDFAKALKLPIVLVARAKLGTINHTLLSIDAIRQKGLSLAGIIINGYDKKTKDFAEKTNAAIIKKLGKVKILAIVPYDKKVNIEKKTTGQKVIKVLQKVNWFKLR